MLYTNQSPADFQKKVTEIKNEYRNNHITTGLKFNTIENDFTETKYVLIVNMISSTKLLYNKEQRAIVIDSIYSYDIKTILELQKDL